MFYRVVLAYFSMFDRQMASSGPRWTKIPLTTCWMRSFKAGRSVAIILSITTVRSLHRSGCLGSPFAVFHSIAKIFMTSTCLNDIEGFRFLESFLSRLLLRFCSSLQAPEPFPEWVHGLAAVGRRESLKPLVDWSWEWAKWICRDDRLA